MPTRTAARVNFGLMTTKGATKQRAPRKKKNTKNNKNNNNSNEQTDDISSSESSEEEEEEEENDENTPLTNGFRDFVKVPRERFTSGETLVTTGWMTNEYMLQNNSNQGSGFGLPSADTIVNSTADPAEAVQQQSHQNSSRAGATKAGAVTEKILFPGPNQDWFRNNFLGNNSRIIGGPIRALRQDGSTQSKSISIVEGGEFFDDDVLAVFSRMPHIDPNDPRNATVVAIMNQTKQTNN